MLSDYILSMTNDRCKAEDLTVVLMHLNVPMKTFSMAVRLYKRVIVLAEQETRRQKHFYQHRRGLEALFFKTAKSGAERRWTAAWGKRSLEGTGEDVFSLEKLVSNPYLLLIACSMIAYKYNKDIPYANEMWAEQARLDCQHVNRIERMVLEVLDYQIDFDGEKEILDEMKPYLTNECSMPWIEKKKKKKIYRRIFCF